MSVKMLTKGIAASLLASIASVDAAADNMSDPFEAKFFLSAGGFFTDHDTDVKLDTEVGLGTSVNLENDLGLDSKSRILRIDGYWQFANRHRLNFATFDLSQKGIQLLEKNLLIDGEPFTVGTEVTTDWELHLYEIGYSYRLVSRPKLQWWINVAAFIQDTSINVTETFAGGDVSTEDMVLPLPKIGTLVEYAFTKRWIARAGIDFFKLEISDFGGSLLDLRASLDYRITDHFGIGVGWHLIDIEVDLDKSVSGWQGKLDWETQGPMIYGSLTW